MTDPVTIGLGAAALFVAGVTAVANMASAYSQYRSNHPRKNQTGPVNNYTACHEGYSLTQPQQYQQHQAHSEAPIYTTYVYMLQAPAPQPSCQHFYAQPSTAYPQPSTPAYLPDATQQQPPRNTSFAPQPPKGSSFSQRHFPNSSKVLNLVLGRTSTAPELPQQQQFRPGYQVSRSISAPPAVKGQPGGQHSTFSYHGPGIHQQVPVPQQNTTQHIPSWYPGAGLAPPQHGYGVSLVLEKQQRSPDTLPDTNIGMHTGRKPGYNEGMAKAHWYHFQNNSLIATTSLNNVDSTIAVVDWSERVITMYVYSKPSKKYFRNYHVQYYDLGAFGRTYQANYVFTGILKDSWLVCCNDDLKVVEDDGACKVKSSNCWSLLGIQGHIPGDLLFVEMNRAALFGLLQCRSKDPTLLNVDMVGDDRTAQFVHVDSQYKNLETKGDCWFSVFTFGTNQWAEGRVLVG